MEAYERMVRWKKWVYIRNARPRLANWAYSLYDTRSYKDLLALQKKSKLTPAQADVFLVPRPAEMLFNIDEDYHQLNNLAEQSEHKEVLDQMRMLLDQWQNRTGDTIPDNLTKDIINRITYKRKADHKSHTRGTTPGSESNATTIIDPGPI